MLQNFLSTQSSAELIAKPDTLAVLRFADASPDPLTPSIRVAQLPHQANSEVWKVRDGDTNQGKDNGCFWHRSNNLQFVSICADLNEGDDYQQITNTVYQNLLKFIGNSDYPDLVRFWNYIPNINQGDGDSENYKRFCNGRLKAFNEHAILDCQFPAASAVGHYGNGITVCALSTVGDPQHHTNPRQVDAFKYPRQYGPSSPSFARATTVMVEDNQLCFISGTASILGHNSVHQDDLRLQLYTTNDNILYLLEEAGFTADAIQTLRVYLRHKSDFSECKRICEALFTGANIIYSHADICRADLLVEIECFCVSN